MPFSRKTEEERAGQAAQKEQRRREEQERKRLQAIEKARLAFFKMPAGSARTAFERGDHLFQCAFDVMNQKAIVVAMVGSTTSKTTSDPTDVLNSVCREGWEIVSGSFVFVEQGHQSRDKFMSSGQNVAVKGAVVGYYVFKRSEQNRLTPLPTPWVDAAEDAALAAPDAPTELEASEMPVLAALEESAEARDSNAVTPQAELLPVEPAGQTPAPAAAEPAAGEGSEPPYWPPPPDWQPSPQTESPPDR